MLASIIKTSLVIKYITVSKTCWILYVQVCVWRGTGSWQTSVTYTLVYSIRHFDGHRFITFIHRERNIWMVMIKSNTTLSNVICISALPKFYEFEFFLYQNLLWFVDFPIGKFGLIQRKKWKVRKKENENCLSYHRVRFWFALVLFLNKTIWLV